MDLPIKIKRRCFTLVLVFLLIFSNKFLVEFIVIHLSSSGALNIDVILLTILISVRRFA